MFQRQSHRLARNHVKYTADNLKYTAVHLLLITLQRRRPNIRVAFPVSPRRTTGVVSAVRSLPGVPGRSLTTVPNLVEAWRRCQAWSRVDGGSGRGGAWWPHVRSAYRRSVEQTRTSSSRCCYGNWLAAVVAVPAYVSHGYITSTVIKTMNNNKR